MLRLVTKRICGRNTPSASTIHSAVSQFIDICL
jgi:hypothetical protein